MLDERGARIVADVFAFTNEIRFDAEERWLYVVETSGRRITRLRIGANAEVEEHEVFGPSDTGGFIDGIAFDAHGNLTEPDSGPSPCSQEPQYCSPGCQGEAVERINRWACGIS